ncbi:carbohydrate porin [Oculatella sp. LEGE 06141]|nr:carbohydrate porin [Oculatella sp. LEGE 06141]
MSRFILILSSISLSFSCVVPFSAHATGWQDSETLIPDDILSEPDDGFQDEISDLRNALNDELSDIEPAAGIEPLFPSLEDIDRPSVSQLADVQPDDWAFEALRSLVERYGCVTGFPDGTYQGDRPLTRNEFAAGLNACLTILQELERALEEQRSEQSDFRETLRRLQEDFAAELTALQALTNELEPAIAELEANQFSTTMQLGGSLVTALSDLTGDTADGNPDTRLQSNLALNYRTRFNLTTSFTGRDRLLVRLQASNRTPNFNGASGTNMTRLSFEVGNTDNNLRLNLLEYRFPVGDRLDFYIYGNAASHHYYATVSNPLFASFGGGKGTPSRFLDRNPIYRIGDVS